MWLKLPQIDSKLKLRISAQCDEMELKDAIKVNDNPCSAWKA
jgi:hypothetical protein